MRAVVLLSGGQDSATCLFWARQQFEDIAAVSFDYGQRHRVELALAQQLASGLGIPWTLLPVEALRELSQASLTNPLISNDEDEEGNAYALERGLPPSFVPGRNVLFFTLAAAWGVPRGYHAIVTGVCQQDRAGYPDCRSEFVEAMETTLRLALDLEGFEIHAPLLDRSKAETWALADELGVLDRIILHTHTCYEGVRSVPHEWGHGCGECGACAERRRGFEEFRRAVAR